MEYYYAAPLTSEILNILSEHRKIPDNEKEGHTVKEFSEAIINKIDNMVLEGKNTACGTSFPGKSTSTR